MVSDVVGATVIMVDVVGTTTDVATDWIWVSSKVLVVRPPARVV